MEMVYVGGTLGYNDVITRRSIQDVVYKDVDQDHYLCKFICAENDST